MAGTKAVFTVCKYFYSTFSNRPNYRIFRPALAKAID